MGLRLFFEVTPNEIGSRMGKAGQVLQKRNYCKCFIFNILGGNQALIAVAWSGILSTLLPPWLSGAIPGYRNEFLYLA